MSNPRDPDTADNDTALRAARPADELAAARALIRSLRRERVSRIESTFEGLGLPLRRLGRQNALQVPLEAFEAIHARLVELTALASQNALVAGDPAHAGWGVPAGWSPEPAPEVERPPRPEGSVDCSEPICDAYAVPDGPNLYRCPRGHLTIHATPEDDPA